MKWGHYKIKNNLLTGAVRWTQTVQEMIADGAHILQNWGREKCYRVWY